MCRVPSSFSQARKRSSSCVVFRELHPDVNLPALDLAHIGRLLEAITIAYREAASGKIGDWK
jgi:hypothetical protein